MATRQTPVDGRERDTPKALTVSDTKAAVRRFIDELVVGTTMASPRNCSPTTPPATRAIRAQPSQAPTPPSHT